jgi:tetratricopeptide (TPR) repeat protein
MPVRSILLLSFALAAFLLGTAPPLYAAGEVGGLEQAAEEAFARDELDLAGALYRQAAQQAAEPAEKARLLVSAGSVDFLAGRREGALAALAAALRLDPAYRFPRDLYDESFGNLFFEAQQRLAAERETAATEALREGAVHLRDQRWDKAREAFQRALGEKPDQPRALYNLALADLHLGNEDAALAGFQKLVSLDASTPGTLGRDLRALTLTNLGLLYIGEKSYPEAEAALEEAVKLDPGNQPAWSNLGVVRRRLGKTLPAADAFRRAADLAPNDPGALNNLALAYIDAKDWMSAVALLHAATKSNPQNPSLWLNFGLSQQGLGNEQGAIESFEAAIRTDPENKGGWAAAAALYLATYHFGVRNYAAVKQQAARALGFDPHLVNAWVYQGLAQKGLGDLAGAKISLEKARDLEPRSAETHNSLGSVYFELGLFEQAESAFELALHLKPELKDAKANLEAAKQARIRASLGVKTGGAKAPAAPAAPSLPAVPEIGLRFSKIDYKSLGMSGLMIETVLPDTAAARAGFLAGDLLLRIDGREVSSEKQLRDLLGSRKGRTLSVDLLRANRPTALRLVVP